MFSTDVTRISIDPEVSEHVVLVPLDTWREIMEFCRRHGEVLPSFDVPTSKRDDSLDAFLDDEQKAANYYNRFPYPTEPYKSDVDDGA